MTPQLTPSSSGEDSNSPRSRTGGNGALTADHGSGLGVRPGESDPTWMLSGVLLLVLAMITIVLAWWLV